AVVTLVDMHRDDALAMAARRRRLRFTRAAPIAAAVLEPLALPEPLRVGQDVSPFIDMITKARRSWQPPWPWGPGRRWKQPDPCFQIDVIPTLCAGTRIL